MSPYRGIRGTMRYQGGMKFEVFRCQGGAASECQKAELKEFVVVQHRQPC